MPLHRLYWDPLTIAQPVIILSQYQGKVRLRLFRDLLPMKHKRKHQSICQDREPQSPINHLPDEVLLEIFDFYRRGIYPQAYEQRWKKWHAWIRLTHVCRRWRAVMLASSSRLDLGITVGPQKPSHIRTILSSPLPIFIDYKHTLGYNTGSALWRMRAALKHHDRVREISFGGMSGLFDRLFEVTQCAFPVLESLSLFFGNDYYHPKLPDTFLRGPELSNLHLQRLELDHTILEHASEFLLSATALTDLFLQIDTAFSPSAKISLLTCLQGMPCLCSLDLSLKYKSSSQPPTPKDIVQLSKLTFFHYVGPSSPELDSLVAGISAPALQDVDFKFNDDMLAPIVHLPRFIDEIEKHYHCVFMVFLQYDFQDDFCLSLLTQSEYNGPDKPRFNFGPVRRRHPESIVRMCDALSTKLTTVKELHVIIFGTYANLWEDFIPWRMFLQRFLSVKTFRIEGANSYIGRILSKESDNDLGFLPALKEIELGNEQSDECALAAELETFQPFVNARQQAGRPVKVFIGE